MRESQLHFSANADGVLLCRQGGRGVDQGPDRLGNGNQRGSRRGLLLNRDGAASVSLSGVKKHRLGHDGEACVVAQRHGRLERRFQGRQVVIPQRAAAVVDDAGAAEPCAVPALDGAQLHLRFLAGIDGVRPALDAHPWSAQRRQIALLQFLVGEALAGAVGRSCCLRRRGRLRRLLRLGWGNLYLLLVLLRRFRHFQGRGRRGLFGSR